MVQKVVEHFGSTSTGPVGITFPGVVLHGVVQTAANMDKELDRLRRRHDVQRPARLARCTMMNDADAAGVAEMRFGAGPGTRAW